MRQRGAVLVEFALISLALYILVFGSIELGRAVFAAQHLQNVAQLAARELALTPLPATATLADALASAAVRARVFDPTRLVLDLDALPNAGDPGAIDQAFAALPVVNRMLRPLFIFDLFDGAGGRRRLLRYPGALVVDPSAPSGLGVVIPRIVARGANGIESVDWSQVVEEIPSPGGSPFSIASAERGLVAVRLNYPFQAGSLSAFQPNPEGPFEPNLGRPVEASDAGVRQVAPIPGGLTLAAAGDGAAGPYAGSYGLGRQLALGRAVRPFRRLITGQALFRREIFE